MNREKYYQLRHNIRASGWSWNGGSRLTVEDNFKRLTGIGRSMSTGQAKTPAIELVASTLKSIHDVPKNIDMEATDSENFMRLVHEWNQAKRRKRNWTRVSWQNYIRSSVRNDRAIFSEQLTKW